MYKRKRSKYVILWISRLGSYEAKRKLNNFWSFVLTKEIKNCIISMNQNFRDNWDDLFQPYSDKVEIDQHNYDPDMKKYTCVCNGIVVKRNQMWRIKIAQLPGYFTDPKLTYLSTTRL